MVTVVHGADYESSDLAGRTVGDVRKLYRNVFNIGDDAIAKVNGKQVGEDHVLKEDEKLVFEKTADKYAGEASASSVRPASHYAAA